MARRPAMVTVTTTMATSTDLPLLQLIGAGSTGALGSAASFSSVVNVSGGATLDLNGFTPDGASPLMR